MPDSWLNVCAYDIAGNGWDIAFKIPGGKDGTPDRALFDLRFIWDKGTLDELLRSGNADYFGTLHSQISGTGYLVAVYGTDLQDTQQTDDLPQVLDSITPKGGVFWNRFAYPVGLPDYYEADGFNDADSLIVANYLCGRTFIGFTTDTMMYVEDNPAGNFFNIDVDGIGYFTVERCTMDFENGALIFKLYCGDVYAEVTCYSGKDFLLLDLTSNGEPLLSDSFYQYTAQ